MDRREHLVRVQRRRHLEGSDRVHVGGDDRNAGVRGLRVAELVGPVEVDIGTAL